MTRSCRPLRSLLAYAALGLLSAGASVAADEATRRAVLVDEVVATQARYGDRPFTPETLAALGRTERHLFVPAELRDAAYANRPLPIGYGQTISQPYIVALMTDLLRVGAGDRVLEVGTGSGYQAAVLAELVAEVYTIEIVPPLARRAARDLARLGYDNVTVREGDGYRGWPDQAPFDAIIITAAPPRIPEPLLEQLKPGGRMVLPVGEHYQELVLITRDEQGLHHRRLIPVRFVPMTGEVRDEVERDN